MKSMIYIIAAAALLAGCDALEQNPTTSVTTDTAITSVEDLEHAVNGAYYIATYGTSLTIGSELAIYGDLIGPDSYQPSSSGQNASRIAQFAMTPNDTYNAYFYLYSALASVNNAIDKGLNLEDQEGAAPYIAELYAMRALFHFHLAVLFAPIPTSGSSNGMGLVISDKVFEINYIGKRATLDETYSFIISDLGKAIDSGLNQERKTGHMNLWSALGLRARAYLYWGKYDKALADCERIIGQAPYTLWTIDEYPKVWTAQGSAEVMMEYLQTDTYNAQRFSPGYYTSPKGYSEYGVSPEFYQWLTSDNRDIRGSAVADRTTVPEGETDYHTGYYPLKYPGNSGASVPMYVNNIKVQRLSEIYLIAAEAALRTGGDAAGYINVLRSNRIRGYEQVATVTLKDILDERRKELFAEGQIALDFWRNGMTVETGLGPIGPDDHRSVLPLPKEEIDLSRGKLTQNPGYGN